MNGPARRSALDDDGADADAALQAVAANELGRMRWRARRVLAKEHAVMAQYVLRQSGVALRRHGVEAVCEHGDGDAFRVECALMRGCVNAQGQATDDGQPPLGEVAADRSCKPEAGGARATSAYDCESASLKGVQVAARVNERWGVSYVAQWFGVVRIAVANDRDVVRFT